MTAKFQKYLTQILIALIVLALFGFVFLIRSGWQPTAHLNVGGGSVSITIPESGTTLYVDNAGEHTSSKQDEVYTISGLADRDYIFAVSKKGFWPWEKTVTVAKGANISLYPFTVPVVQAPVVVSQDDPRFNDIHQRLLNLTAPTEKNPVLSTDKNTAIWITGNTIYASWLGPKENTPSFFCGEGSCDSTTTVLSSQSGVLDVDFYKDYSNTIVFSDESGVFVIEIQKGGTQNFQPILKTGNPAFIKDPDGNGIFIESEGQLLHLKY